MAPRMISRQASCSEHRERSGRSGRHSRRPTARRPGPRAGSSPHRLARSAPRQPPSSTEEPISAPRARRPSPPARSGTRPAAPVGRQDPGRRPRARLARLCCRCRSSPLAARWSTATTPSPSQSREAGLANPGSSPRWARAVGRLLSDSARDVRQAPPQPPVARRVEVEVKVERGRLIIDRVNDHGSRAELPAARRQPPAPFPAERRRAQRHDRLTSHSTENRLLPHADRSRPRTADSAIVAMPTIAFVAKQSRGKRALGWLMPLSARPASRGRLPSRAITPPGVPGRSDL